MFILAGIVLGVLLVGVIVLYSVFFIQGSQSQPIVTIQSPRNGVQIISGDILVIDAIIRDAVSPISRIELWQVEGERFRLISIQEPADPEQMISIQQSWQPLDIGEYHLIVRAFNEQENTGQAAVDIEIQEVPAFSGENDSTPSREIAFEENLTASMAGTLSTNETDDLFDEPVSESNQNQNKDSTYTPPPFIDTTPLGNRFEIENITSAFFQVYLDLFQPQTYDLDPPVMIEAVDFQVEEDYDAVYCYFTAADEPPRRVPQSGPFDTSGDRHWNIRDYLGGRNSVLLPIPHDLPLMMSLQCKARENGVQGLIDLGEVDVSHPPEDWNGITHQKSSSGGEGFTVSYRIKVWDPEDAMLIHLAILPMGSQNLFQWSLDGDPSQIGYYLLQRNNCFIRGAQSDQQQIYGPKWWTDPPCGEEYQYSIIGMYGTDCGEEREFTSPSNYVRFQSPPCTGDDNIQLLGKPEPICDGTGYQFNIQYTYKSSHIPFDGAHLGIRFFSEENPESRQNLIHSTNPVIKHGEGKATVFATFAEPAVPGAVTETGSFQIFMFNKKGQFFSKSIDHDLTWNSGYPDLKILNSEVNWEFNKVKIWVKNIGCGLASETQIKVERDSDGWSTEADVPSLSGKVGRWVVVNLPGKREDWAEGITLTVDPYDAVPESEEENNQYHLSGPNIKEVRVYKIEIFNDHEARKSNPGEWKLRFGSYPPPTNIWRNYQWGEGTHQINNLVFYPETDNNIYQTDRFFIDVKAYENDPSRIEYVGRASGLHLDDPTDPNTWKQGGNFVATSDSGDFKIYYRIILE